MAEKRSIAIIDRKGRLHIDGKRGVVGQYCPYSNNEDSCGDWCPQFGVADPKYDPDGSGRPIIKLCFNVLRPFDEILDDRGNGVSNEDVKKIILGTFDCEAQDFHTLLRMYNSTTAKGEFMLQAEGQFKEYSEREFALIWEAFDAVADLGVDHGKRD